MSLTEYLEESKAAHGQYEKDFCASFLQGLTNAHHREALASTLGGSPSRWEELKAGVERMIADTQGKKRHKRTLN